MTYPPTMTRMIVQTMKRRSFAFKGSGASPVSASSWSVNVRSAECGTADHDPNDAWARCYPKSPGAMSVKREKWPWNATVMVSVGPLRCFATIRSASPARGESFS